METAAARDHKRDATQRAVAAVEAASNTRAPMPARLLVVLLGLDLTPLMHAPKRAFDPRRRRLEYNILASKAEQDATFARAVASWVRYHFMSGSGRAVAISTDRLAAALCCTPDEGSRWPHEGSRWRHQRP